MSLFSGYARQVAALPRAQQPAQPLPQGRGLFGGSRPRPMNALQTFIMGTDARDAALERQRQEEALRQRTAIEDRLRAQLSPADGPMGSGTGAAPDIQQQMAALDEARLLNPQVAEQFAPIVQQRRMAELTRGRPVEEQLAVELNPDEAGTSYATQFRDMALAKGTQRSRGSSIVAEAPDNVTVNDTIFAVDSRGARPLATAEPAYNDVTGRINANTVSVAPADQVYRDGRLYVESTAQRPMSDADQKAIADAELAVERANQAITRAQNLRTAISGGQLNLGPLTNAISGGLNFTGRSTENSRGLADLEQWAKQARDAILAANTGVQTDQDAVRALDNVLANMNDERLVGQYLDQFITATTGTRGVFERNIARRSGQPTQPGGAPAPQVSREAALAELRRRGLL